MYLQLYIKKTQDSWLEHEQQTNEHICKYTEDLEFVITPVYQNTLIIQYQVGTKKASESTHAHTHTQI